VARSAPDGNTLLMVAPGFVANPHLRKLNYDPLTNFEPICNLVQSPQVIVVNSASPYRSFPDLVNAARARPGELSLAGTGPATSTHIAFEVFRRANRIDMTFVPFPGNGPTMNALLGGHVTSAELNYADVSEHLKAGKIRPLATPMRTRIEPLPDLPTVTETGYIDFEMDIWFGVVAPAKTPKETLDQLAGWFTAAMAAQEVRSKLIVQGLYPDTRCGTPFGAFLRKVHDDYARAIRDAGIKAE
jgi:tripartite-type tricarboxylate transporter receptor subunit TctC